MDKMEQKAEILKAKKSKGYIEVSKINRVVFHRRVNNLDVPLIIYSDISVKGLESCYKKWVSSANYELSLVDHVKNEYPFSICFGEENVNHYDIVVTD